MDRSAVLLFQGDRNLVQTLVESLSHYFLVNVAHSIPELETGIVQSHPVVIVFDTELAALEELGGLCHQHPDIRFICNHRLADEALWAAALGVGAADVCASADAQAITASVLQNINYPLAA